MTGSRRAIVLAAVALALAGGSGALARTRPAFDGPTLAHPTIAPDFALHDQSGRLVRLSGQRGRVVLLTFLYTHCPDQCPLTAENLNQALQLLGPRRAGTRVLAVSVDPAGDRPRAVATFVRVHGLLPEFHYLTGRRSTLRPIWRRYGVQSTAELGDRVDHTLFVLLIDRSGRGRVLYDATARPAAIAHDLRLLLTGA